MYLNTLQKIRSIIEEVGNGERIPIEPSALKSNEAPMEYLPSEEELYHILNKNLLHMDWLLPIKWSNEVMK